MIRRLVWALPILVHCLVEPRLSSADDWPQWRGPKRDGIWRETGIVRSLPQELRVLWRTQIGGGYAGPAVANGRVFVADRRLESGEKSPENPFDKSPLRGRDRVLALDADTGAELWSHEYPAQYEVSYPSGPRATPTVDGDRVYAVGVMGELFCLDAATGKLIWSRHYVEDFDAEINVWGASAAPLVDGDLLIVLVGGRPDACVVALDKMSGDVRWKALNAPDPGYCPPVIFEVGNRRELIVWTPLEVAALDPKSGAVQWREPFAVQSALTIPTPTFDPASRQLFLSSFYNGSLLLELGKTAPGAKVLWRGKSQSEKDTDGLHAIMCTPVRQEETIYGVCSYGQLRALDAASGTRLWETTRATGSGRWWHAFLVPHEDRFFIHNEQGELIIARLSREGYVEDSRAKLIEPTQKVNRRMVVWSHPAFAQRSVFARNDHEILRVDLSEQ